MSELLVKVDFEHIEAERDPNLVHYFVETQSFYRIFGGKKMYVIGRKGTGKSTIYSAIENMPRNSDMLVAGLTFDDYPWGLHNQVRDETKSIDAAHTTTWRYIILIELAKLLLEEAKQIGKQPEELRAVAKFVQSAYGTAKPSLKELLTSLFKRLRQLKRIELPRIGQTGAAGGSVEFEEGIAKEKAILDTVKVAADAIQEAILGLLTKKHYFVLFDKLDDGWDNTDAFKSSMVGLLRSARDLNIEANRRNKLLRCVVFLRSDIYDCLQYNDKNKAFPDIEFLAWTEASLDRLINKRIAKSLGLRSEKNAWDKIFERETMRQRTSNFRYIVRRTLLRPRDLIAFCQECKTRALHNKHDMILNSDVYEAEAMFSERTYREFLDEMHKQFPFVDKLFEVLRRLHCERFDFYRFLAEFQRARIPRLDARSALKILFDYSIVGVTRVGGRVGGSTVEFKYTDPLIQLDFSRQMVAHPCLKKHLKLIEKRARKHPATEESSEAEAP